MWAMEYALLGDALQKLPMDGRLLNAQLAVGMRVTSGEELESEQNKLVERGVRNGVGESRNGHV